MRTSLLAVTLLGLVACGDDSSGSGGGGGEAATTSGSAGEGGGGPTTTGAGGILDDGTEAATDACNAARDAELAASDELGCGLEDDNEKCAETSSTWVGCVDEWKAFFDCAAATASAETCTCGDGEPAFACDYETACASELDALDACDT